MPRVLLSADTHVGAANMLRHCRRPFASVGDVDEVLVARWNADGAPARPRLGPTALVREAPPPGAAG